MTTFLPNYLSGAWQAETERIHILRDPVTGEELAATGGRAAGLEDGFDFTRRHGGKALKQMNYAQRAAMLGEVLKVLQANREEYYRIALANSGTTQADSAIRFRAAGSIPGGRCNARY